MNLADAALASLIWAHGADPRPITWDEATRNLVTFFVTIFLALAMSYPVLAPLFSGRVRQEGGAEPDQGEGAQLSSGLVGWLAAGLALILSMGWWLTRTSLVELTAAETPKPDHRHTQERGGQVAMWADFHAEVARIESGEVRVYLTDSYNRPIAARYFSAEITPSPGRSEQEAMPEDISGPGATATPTGSSTPVAGPTATPAASHATVPALDDSYRFARLDRADTAYRVKVSTPGWSVNLKFAFDDSNGRRSLPIWCGTPDG